IATGNPDTGDFDRAFLADAKPHTRCQGAEIDSAGRKILTNLPLKRLHAFVAELVVKFLTEDADGTVGTAMMLAVSLPIAADAIGGDGCRQDWQLGHATGRHIYLE